jgi:hypothetical protein
VDGGENVDVRKKAETAVGSLFYSDERKHPLFELAVGAYLEGDRKRMSFLVDQIKSAGWRAYVTGMSQATIGEVYRYLSRCDGRSSPVGYKQLYGPLMVDGRLTVDSIKKANAVAQNLVEKHLPSHFKVRVSERTAYLNIGGSGCPKILQIGGTFANPHLKMRR